MTDVPFFSLAVASASFLVRGLRPRSRRDYVVGLGFAVAATLVRQVGVVIPVAFAGAYLVRARGYAPRWRTITRAALPAVIVLGTLVLYRIWLAAHVGLPELHDARSEVSVVLTRGLLQHVGNAAWGGYVTLVHLGLFLLPISAVLLLQRCRDRLRRARFLVLAFALTVVGVAVAVYRGEFMPLIGNILFDLGLGPPTLRDVLVLELDHLPSAPGGVWVALTALAITSVAVLVSHVVLGWNAAFRWRGSPQDALRTSFSVLVLLAGILHMAPMAGAGLFDRYMIILIPLVLVLVAHSTDVRQTRPTVPHVGVGVAVALVLGALSVAGTHDYLSWNRARWTAAHHLMEDVGVRPTEMDGGFEFNGYYLYDERYEPRADVSWWWVDGEAYVLAFGPVDGYDLARTYSFRRWLSVGEGRVLILRKATGTR